MKLKYYLRGLGVGIICTAIIMGIALSGNEKEKLTDAEIIERARLLGMVMEDEIEEEEETDSEADDSAGTEQQDNEPDQSAQTGTEETDAQTPEEVTPQTPEETGTQTPEEQTPQPEMKTIEILPGEYSDVVSQKLAEAGLVQDAEAFNKYLMDSGKDKFIMTGVHQIPMGATEDEIIRILGEKPEKTE